METCNTFITWISDKQRDKGIGIITEKNCDFYKKVKHFDTIYEEGEGAYLSSVELININDIGKIMYLYENLDGTTSKDRYLAFVEVFMQPRDIGRRAAGYNLDLNEDIDLIQWAFGHTSNTRFRTVPIEELRGSCKIIYADALDYPLVVQQKFRKKHNLPTNFPIYVCRYNMARKNNKYIFQSAIIPHRKISSNEELQQYAIQNRIILDDSDEEILGVEHLKNVTTKPKQYRVTAVECQNESVKLKLKRKSISNPDENDDVPTVLIERLNIEYIDNNSPRKPLSHCIINEDNASPRRSARPRTPINHFKNSDFEFSKENSVSPSRRSSRPRTPIDYKFQFYGSPNRVISNQENCISEPKIVENSSKSRRKQNFSNTMYSEDVEIEVQKKTFSLNTPTKNKTHNSKKDARNTPVKSISKKKPEPEEVVKNKKSSSIIFSDSDDSGTNIKQNKSTKAKNTSKKVKSPPAEVIKTQIAELVKKRRNSIVFNSDSEENIITEGRRSTRKIIPPKKYREETPEPEETTYPKKLVEVKDDYTVDTLSSKLQAKLGIVTPQKTPTGRPTPQRRRLAKLDEESDDEPQSKTPRKNKNTPVLATELSTRKSTRLSLRNAARSIEILLDDSDDDYIRTPIKTPRRTAATPRKTPLNKKISSIIEDSYTPKRKKSIDENYIESTPKKTISTPKKGTPSRIKITALPAVIETRATEFTASDNPFELARAQLHANLKPGCLPCREKEFDDITQFINGKLTDNSGGCMYISGVPGTGKTATVCEIMKVLNDDSKKRKLPNFKFISVNALSLTEPRQVYVEIGKQISGKTMHWDEALTYIRNFFLKQKHLLHVMLIDELDKLCTRKQDVVYNLLDLPSNSKTPLVVITIANTMDLPERLLSNKVNSRLGLTRLTFRPYKHKELIDIVRARLSAYSKVFRNEALEFVARKVAAVSGDARRALAICSRATEIAEKAKETEITMDIINKTLNDMISSPKVQAIKSCSKTEKFILQAIASEVERTGNDEVPFTNMVKVIDGLCILESVAIPNVCHLLMACQKLNFFRLIIMQEGKHDVANTLLLNCSPDDIHFALKEN